MHKESYQEMQKFVRNYLNKNKKYKILDVGSYNVNGTYKDLFIKWDYQGLDIAPGNNVDIISLDPYKYPVKNSSFDVVISGQTGEHIKDIYTWAKEIGRIVKKKGLACIIIPCKANEHKSNNHNRDHTYFDCWRIYPDGMEFLFGIIAGLTKLEIYTNSRDTIGIFTKL